jgi:DNA adenine methylase
MDYVKKTQKELKDICREQKIKGYSNKKKDELIKLLQAPIADKKESIKNKSPLRYPGGKTRAIPVLESYLIKYYPNKKKLLSPFFGGGSFELYMKTKGYSVNGNDLFVPLYTFWKTQQSDCDLLIQKIREKIPVTKDIFHQLRSSISSTTDNHDKASSYFIINRTSFSGATLCGGFSIQASEKRLTESSILRLKLCDTSNITFTNLDCNAFLSNNPETPDTVVYADPPYYISTYLYGKDGDMHEKFNHEMFAKTMLNRKDWIISYNDCEYIRNLYKDCQIFKVNWSYGMNASKESSEIIILPPLSS